MLETKWSEEALLKECSIDAERVERYALEKISRKPGQQRARAEATVDEDTVDIYGSQYREGAEFPAIVVLADGKSSTLLSGNHRVPAALSAGVTHHPALVVRKATDAQLRKFVAIANARHGRPSSIDDRCYHAETLHEVHGVPLDDAAKIAGVPASRVRSKIKRRRVADRCADLGVTCPARASVTERLDTVTSDGLFKALATVEGRFNSGEFSLLATRASQARSEDHSLQIVVDAAKEKEVEAAARAGLKRAKVGVSGAYVKLRTIARSVRKHAPTEVEIRAMTDDMRAAVRAEVEGAIRALSEVMESL